MLQAFLDDVKRGVVLVGEQFTDPDDDWEPVVFANSDDGVAIVGIPGQFLASEGLKNQLADVVLPQIAKRMQASAMAFVSSAWMLMAETGQSVKDLPRPSDSPDRVEVVQVVACSLDDFVSTTARIVRDGVHPPTLSEWEDNDVSFATAGRFPDALRKALS